MTKSPYMYISFPSLKMGILMRFCQSIYSFFFRFENILFGWLIPFKTHDFDASPLSAHSKTRNRTEQNKTKW